MTTLILCASCSATSTVNPEAESDAQEQRYADARTLEDSASLDGAIELDAVDADVLDASAKTFEAAPAFVAAVASGPSQSFVVWVDERNLDLDIYGSRVDSNGTILDPGGIPISVELGNEHRPDVAWTGSHYLVTWMDRRGSGTRIYATRIGTDGVSMDPGGFPLSPEGDYSQIPKVSSGSNGSVVVFEGPCGNQCTGVVAVSIDDAGTTSPLSVIAPTGRAPAIASDGAGFLISYTDYRNGPADLYAQRLDNNGNPLVGEIAVSLASQEQLMSTIAGGQDGYVVAWVDTRSGALKHYWTTVSSEGVLGDSKEVSSTPRWQDPPQVAYSDGYYHLVWTEVGTPSSAVDTYLGTFSTASNATVTGTLLQKLISDEDSDERSPTLDCGTSQCSIAWHQFMGGTRSVVGSMLAPNGQPQGGGTTLWSTIDSE